MTKAFHHRFAKQRSCGHPLPSSRSSLRFSPYLL
jgi:hypothetical protein